MPTYSLNMIGAGKLGQTIGRLLVQSQQVEVLGVVNATLESAAKAAAFIGQGVAYQTIEQLPQADIYFITTRDDCIQAIAQDLAIKNVLQPGVILVHCSGALSATILSAAQKKGCYIASIHPLKSFANPEQSVATFSGTYCALEGDAEAKSTIASLFTNIGGMVFEIDQAHKKLYHAASVIANNYLVSLHYHAYQCYVQSGVDEDIAKKMVSMLMSDALNNINAGSHHAALTGPLQRGDSQTIRDHLAILQTSVAPETQNIYRALALGTLTLTRHPEEIQKIFREILWGKDGC